MGIVVPIPYYLQEWMQVPYWSRCHESAIAQILVFFDIPVSDADMEFIQDLMSDKADWLIDIHGGIYGTYDLTVIFQDKVIQVSYMNLYIICYF